MKRTGLALIFISLIPPLYMFWGYMGEHQFSILFSQYAGIVSLLAMSWVQLMATRVKGMEALFGPLDQIYVLHKWLAVAAIVAAFLHDNIEASAVTRDGIEGGLGRDCRNTRRYRVSRYPYFGNCLAG
jgi:predicted ferric reductase